MQYPWVSFAPMSFKTYFMGLSEAQRDDFAKAAGTSVGLCKKLIYGDGRVELGLADVMVKLGNGAFVHGDLPLTDRAKFQALARAGEGVAT